MPQSTQKCTKKPCVTTSTREGGDHQGSIIKEEEIEERPTAMRTAPGNGPFWNHGYKALLIEPILQVIMPRGVFNMGRRPCGRVGVKVSSKEVWHAMVKKGEEEGMEKGGGRGSIVVEVKEAQGLR